MAAKFRKRPVVIEAVKWNGDNSDEIYAFFGEQSWGEFVGAFSIKTLEGVMMATPGDWIIKGVKGEFYPCKPDIFEATYEPVEEG